jgi:flagellar assembly factor FliW
MNISTARFGVITVKEDDIITFPEGIVGFFSFKRYCLYEREGDAPFKWLQSVEEPGLAFVVADPRIFIPDYEVQVTPADLAPLALKDVSGAQVLVIVAIDPNDPQGPRVNLRAPVVIDMERKTAKQLILSDEYPLRYHLFHERSA